MKFHSIAVTKGRRLAARFTYSRGRKKTGACVFPQESERAAGYTCVSHEGSRQRLASGNKLRVVLFTSSRKLDTKAGKKERRQLRMPSWKAARVEKKRFHTAPSKTRTDTFTYFSAPPLSLSYSLFLFLSLSHRPHAFILRCFIQTTNSRNLLAIYVFRYRREQMVPRLPPRFYDVLYLRALIDSRVPQNFHFLFRGVKNNVGSYE